VASQHFNIETSARRETALIALLYTDPTAPRRKDDGAHERATSRL